MAFKITTFQNPNILKAGQKAPDFSVPDQDGNPVSLKDYKGKKVILYFYPKDDTTGCTAEACNLRDNRPLIMKKNYEILGVSADSVKSHKKFATKFNLPFKLLADTEKDIITKYGVWGEKMLFGRKYMGIHRVTFLIDERGIIEQVITDVDTKNHTQQLLG
ncbi:MAG TPA: thioredoxin-dependent thiol peroxidase [Bacteroidia bacterium]|jgi:peroxiredoxin Q/BCP|nr:thioredoxin-dependent thiol peroxidase [Bacteroidia bacterium]